MALDALRGAAQGIAGKALKKVAGNIRGGLLSSLNRGFSDLSDLSLLNSGSKFKTKNYTFPLDVEAPPGLGNQGHYVMFYINVQENSKLLFGDSRRMENFGKKNMNKAASQQGIDGPEAAALSSKKSGIVTADASGDPIALRQGTTKTKKQREDEAVKREVKRLAEMASTVTLKRPPTVRLDTAIALYMPPTVSV